MQYRVAQFARWKKDKTPKIVTASCIYIWSYFRRNYYYLFRSQWWRQIYLFILFIFIKWPLRTGRVEIQMHACSLRKNPYTCYVRVHNSTTAFIPKLLIEVHGWSYKENFIWSTWRTVLRTRAFPYFVRYTIERDASGILYTAQGVSSSRIRSVLASFIFFFFIYLCCTYDFVCWTSKTFRKHNSSNFFASSIRPRYRLKKYLQALRKTPLFGWNHRSYLLLLVFVYRCRIIYGY